MKRWRVSVGWYRNVPSIIQILLFFVAAALFGGSVLVGLWWNGISIGTRPHTLPQLLMLATGWSFLTLSLLFIAANLRWRAAHLWMIARWRAYGLGKLHEFPELEGERNSMRNWAERLLVDAANDASYLFSLRDLHQKSVVDFFKNRSIANPQELAKERSSYRSFVAALRTANKRANAAHKRYLRLWDLFKEMDMLPDDPQGGRWGNNHPNAFREYHRQQAHVERSRQTERDCPQDVGESHQLLAQSDLPA